MGNALAIRSERDSLFRLGLLSNKPVVEGHTSTRVKASFMGCTQFRRKRLWRFYTI